jgi:glutathione S-transferase
MGTRGNLNGVLTLYDAARCPFCARVRIVLAEKGVEYESVEIDLSDRPAWLYEKNPLGKVPVLEEDGWVLPESAVIDEYLEERFPDPPLLPADPGERALARLLVLHFDEAIGHAYYAFRRSEAGADRLLDDALTTLDVLLERRPYLSGGMFGLADVAYLPWLVRARDMLGVSLDAHPSIAAWLERLSERESVVQELGIVAAL